MKFHILFAPTYDKLRCIDGFSHALAHGAVDTLPSLSWRQISSNPKRFVPEQYKAIVFSNRQIPIAFAYELTVQETILPIFAPYALHIEKIRGAFIYYWENRYEQELNRELALGGDYKDILTRMATRLKQDGNAASAMNRFFVSTALNDSYPAYNLLNPVKAETLETLCSLSPLEALEAVFRDVPRRRSIVYFSQEWLTRFPIQRIESGVFLITDSLYSELRPWFVCPWWKAYSCER